MSELPDEFINILMQHLPRITSRDEITLTLDLIVDGGLDSLGMVGLVVGLEEALSIRIPDEDLTGAMFATAGSVWDVVRAAR